MKPQTAAVLDWLQFRAERGLSPQEALMWVGTMRLAARIAELKAAGHDITCDRSEGFGRYRLRLPVGQLEAGL